VKYPCKFYEFILGTNLSDTSDGASLGRLGDGRVNTVEQHFRSCLSDVRQTNK